MGSGHTRLPVRVLTGTPPGVCWQRLLCASPPPLQSGNKWSTEPAGLCEEDGGECASNASHPTSHTASAKTNVIIDCKNTNRELFENFKHSRKNRLLMQNPLSPHRQQTLLKPNFQMNNSSQPWLGKSHRFPKLLSSQSFETLAASPLPRCNHRLQDEL